MNAAIMPTASHSQADTFVASPGSRRDEQGDVSSPTLDGLFCPET